MNFNWNPPKPPEPPKAIVETVANEGESLFDVWIEGYSATGQSENANYEGTYSAVSFKDACEKMMRLRNWDISYYNGSSYWGCRFFDNEADARASFG